MGDRSTPRALQCPRPWVFTGRAAVIVALATGFAACESFPNLTPTRVASSTSSTGSTDLAFCASEINRYRHTIGRPPLTRSTALESNAAAAAEYDTHIRIAHAYFSSPQRLPIVAAETAILWWSGYEVRSVIEKGLAQMWAGGPTTNHYDVLAGPFTQVGCGVYVRGAEITVVQDFR